MKYDDLDYRPTHGSVTVRGESGDWALDVPVHVGRDMEEDGIEVIWPYASCPGWVADAGLAAPYMRLQRLWSLPAQFFR